MCCMVLDRLSAWVACQFVRHQPQEQPIGQPTSQCEIRLIVLLLFVFLPPCDGKCGVSFRRCCGLARELRWLSRMNVVGGEDKCGGRRRKMWWANRVNVVQKCSGQG